MRFVGMLVLSLLISELAAEEVVFGYIQFRPTNKVGIWRIEDKAYWGTRKTRMKPKARLIKKHSCVRVEVNDAQEINKILLLTPKQCRTRIPKPYQFKPYEFK